MAQETEKRIKVKVSTDTTGFNKSLKDINKDLKEAQSEFKKTDTEVKHLGQTTERSKSLHEQLSRQVQLHTQKIDLYKQSIEKTKSKLDEDIKTRERLKTSLDSANKKYQEAVKVYGEESEQAKKAKAEVEKLTKEHENNEKSIKSSENRLKTYNTSLNKAESELIKTKGALNNVTKELREQENKWLTSSKKLNEYKDKLHKTGDTVGKVGDGLLRMTAPLLGLGAIAFKSAVDFESAFAGVRKTVDGTEEDFKQLETGIKDMSKSMPQSAAEISTVAEAAGQLGIKKENILDFTKTMVMMGDSTNMSSDEAATALARLANITQMPQSEFSKLGSVIVALGNNLATTEGEITEMGLRLAGAGHQVGMSEAQILSFSGALSSVGINAEAGGSAFSKVMIQMQLATTKGGKQLQNFAKVSGMSASQFKQAFEKDATGAIIAFIKGLGDCEKNGQSAIGVLDSMGIKEVILRDALLRAAGASDVFSDAINIGTQAWNENNALTNEANQRYETTASKLAMAKNRIMDVGMSLGDTLIPYVMKGVDSLEGLISSFNNLSPSTQEAIIKSVLMGTALGGVAKLGAGTINTVGTLAGGLGKLTEWLGKGSISAGGLGGALGKVSTASTVASGAGGLGALGNVLTKLPLLANPTTLAVAGITAAVGVLGYGTYKAMNEEAIPSIDLFADKVQLSGEQVKNGSAVSMQAVREQTITISEETKKAVGAYIEMDKGATSALNNLYYNSTKLTDENTKDLISKYNNMNTTVLKSMQDRFTKEYGETDAFFKKSKALTEKEEAQILKTKKDNNAKAIKDENESNKKIMDILNKAKKEKRALTEKEQKEINKIQEKKRENAVKTLSKEEVESKVILERLKQSAGRLTAEQASEVIKNAEKQRKNSVDNANKQYDETVAKIIRMRDETGEISEEQANRLIKEAERQRSESIKKAEDMKNQVINKVKEQNKGIEKDVSMSTGNILSAWEKLKNWWDSWKPGRKSFNADITTTETKRILTDARDGRYDSNWTGNRFYDGGLTTLHERGGELYDLPRGTRIFNHELSQEMVLKTAEKVAEKVASRVMGEFSRSGGDTILNIHSPKALNPHEVARQTTKALREIAIIG